MGAVQCCIHYIVIELYTYYYTNVSKYVIITSNIKITCFLNMLRSPYGGSAQLVTCTRRRCDLNVHIHYVYT